MPCAAGNTVADQRKQDLLRDDVVEDGRCLDEQSYDRPADTVPHSKRQLHHDRIGRVSDSVDERDDMRKVNLFAGIGFPVLSQQFL